MNTEWILGMGMLALSNVVLAGGREESQTITEYSKAATLKAIRS